MSQEFRVFSEKEAAEIVQRAVELQEASDALAPDYTPGVTTDELHRIAAEVGLDPGFVDQAIQAHKEQPAASTSSTLQTARHELVLNGELDLDDFDCLLDGIKPVPNTTPTQVGRTFKARTLVGTTTADVTVTSRNGRTRIKIEWLPAIGCLSGFYPATFAMIFAMTATGKAGVPWLGALISIAIVFLAIQGTKAYRAKVASNMEAFAKRIESAVKAQLHAPTKKKPRR